MNIVYGQKQKILALFVRQLNLFKEDSSST